MLLLHTSFFFLLFQHLYDLVKEVDLENTKNKMYLKYRFI